MWHEEFNTFIRKALPFPFFDNPLFDGGWMFILIGVILIFLKGFFKVVKDDKLKSFIINNPIFILYVFLIIISLYFHFIFSLILTGIFLLVFCCLYFYPKYKDKLIRRKWIIIIQIILFGISIFGNILYKHYELQKNQALEVYFMLPPDVSYDSDKNKVPEHKCTIFIKFLKIFSTIFKRIERIKIMPESVANPENFIQKYSFDLKDERMIYDEVVEGVIEMKHYYTDIILKSQYNLTPQRCVVLLTPVSIYANKDNKFVCEDKHKSSVEGSENDLEFIAIQACYKFIKFIKTRKGNILENDETKIWENLLNKFTDFLMLQGKENYKNLLYEIAQALKKPDSLTEDTVEAFLNRYQPDSKLSDNDNEEKMRKTVEARFK